MNPARHRLLNAGLVVVTFAVVALLTIAADRVFGMLSPAPAMPGSMELIFPPHARQTFKSAEFEYNVYINKLGLREREIGPKREDVFRICAIGDSYTYGWGVEAEQTWLRRLEDALNAKGLKVETINLGKPGTGPPNFSEVAEKALPVLQPDLVIVSILMGNDIIASTPEKKKTTDGGAAVAVAGSLFPHFTRYVRRPDVPESQISTEMPPTVSTAQMNVNYTRNTAMDFLNNKWTPDQKEAYARINPRVREAFEAGLFNPYMVDLALKAPDVYNGTLNLEDAWIKGATAAVAEHLKIIAEAADEQGAPTVVVSIPDGPYVNDVAWRNIQQVGYTVPEGMVDSDAPDKAVQMAAEQAGLPCLSAAAEFKKRRAEPGLYFEFDGHFSPTGHALFAEAMTPQLEAIVREEQR